MDKLLDALGYVIERLEDFVDWVFDPWYMP